jgi:large repetitive protein
VNKLFSLLFAVLLVGASPSWAQTSALNPDDPVVRFTATSTLPAQPPFGQIGKWGASTVMGWNTNTFKAYIYKGMTFRLMFPRNYKTDPATKVYPLITFLHGLGERGQPNDNELQLVHGGYVHQQAVLNGTFDGFLLYPQNVHSLDQTQAQHLVELFNIFAQDVRLDLNRISVHGLSGGGYSSWNFIGWHPKMFAAALPMSGGIGDYNLMNGFKHASVWQFQGALDTNPSLGWALSMQQEMRNRNADYKLTVYDDLGHGTWNRAYAEADFFPFIVRANKTNPWVLIGKRDYCTGETISTLMGVTAGFDGYEWRRDGVVVPSATGHELTADQVGTYEVRIRRGTNWSYWSPVPVVVRYRPATATPTITAAGSTALPGANGATSVTLSAPAGMAAYAWSTGATTRTIAVSAEGNYTVSVTEPGGCPSAPSAPLFVKVGNGANPPAAPSGLSALMVSSAQVNLTWTDNATDETNYEVYAGVSALPANISLVAVLPAGSTNFSHTGLMDNTNYYYLVRAVNAGGGSAAITGSARTAPDVAAPSLPTNLVATDQNSTTISLAWQPSTDNVGVSQYEVYRNDQLVGVTPGTTFVAQNLVTGQLYRFRVRARDAAGNLSAYSNQLSAVASTNGLTYQYYEGVFSSLELAIASPVVRQGRIANVDIGPRLRNENIAFRFSGVIRIPTTGTYTFFTESDDGSSLSVNGTQVVSNDFNQGMTERSGTIVLNAGVYPFQVLYRQGTGGYGLNVRWQGPGISKQVIPDGAFSDAPTNLPTPPAAPTNVTATSLSYRQIRINWTDNSNNETQFEIYRIRGTTGERTYAGSANANATSFVDNNLPPSTTFFYEVLAVGSTGESGVESAQVQARYYQSDSPYTNLTQLNTATPLSTTFQGNFGLQARQREDRFGFRFLTHVRVTTAGTYTFFTTSDDGSNLVVNSSTPVNNDFDQGMTERSGSITLAPGVHQIGVNFRQGYGGYGLEVRWQGPGIGKQLLPSAALLSPRARATTAAQAATPPSAPTNLTFTNITPTSVRLTWTDNASSEDRYDILRATSAAGPFAKVGETVVNVATFTNPGLTGLTTYYYRVQAVNTLGTSAPASGSVTTGNNPPAIVTIPDHVVPAGSNYRIFVRANDANSNSLSFAAGNLPTFGNLVDNGDGTAFVYLTPSASETGTYNGVSIQVTDNLGASSTVTFNLVVDNSQLPNITAPASITMSEGQTQTVNLAASDPDFLTGTIAIAGVDLPNFATFTVGANNTATLALAPGFSAAGSYMLRVQFTDPNGSIVVQDIALTVNDTDPAQNVLINFNAPSWFPTAAPAPWNNTNSNPWGGPFNNMLATNGQNSGIGVQMVYGLESCWGSDVTTGNNSGIVPDLVLSQYYAGGVFSGPSSTAQFKLTGLDPSRVYTLRLIGAASPIPGFGMTDPGSTVYTINGQSISLDVQGNTQNAAVFTGLRGDANNEIVVTLSKDPGNVGTSGVFINGIIIESGVSAPNPPAAPENLRASLNPTGRVLLNWSDNSGDELGFEVERATSASGPFTLLNANANNVDQTAYVDNTGLGLTGYFYRVRAVNNNGVSAYSNLVNILTPNYAPVLSPVLADRWLRDNQSVNETISANDSPADVIQFTATNFPSFASLTDNGNGTAQLIISPNRQAIGTYRSLRVQAADDKGGIVSATFDLMVYDQNVQVMNINVNSAAPTTAGGWNNLTMYPFVGATASNLRDVSNQNVGASITFINSWGGANTGTVVSETGTVYGEGTGLVPDEVAKTYYLDCNGTPRNIQLAGLDTAKRYNFYFLSSIEGPSRFTTSFTINGATSVVEANGNSTRWAQLNGVVPNASGQVLIDVNKLPNAKCAVINAIVVHAYDPANTPLMPTSLRAIPASRTSIRLEWLENGHNETAIEVHRATSFNGSYGLVATLPANTTRYTDASLASNTRYFYRVRAVNGANASDFSAIVNAVTLERFVSVNFNHQNQHPMPSPWVNTNSTPSAGAIPRTLASNMRDDANVTTGINLIMETAWTGSDPFGPTTGNNSGVFADNTLRTYYYSMGGEVETMRLTGLDNNRRYNLVFLGSSAFNTEMGSTRFVVNGRTASVFIQDNVSETAQLNDIAPVSGQIVFTAYVNPGVVISAINTLIVQSYDHSVGGGGSNREEEERGLTGTGAEARPFTVDDFDASVMAYPNPFEGELQVSFALAQADEAVVELTDALGKLISRQNSGQMNSGRKHVLLNGFDGLPAGVYLLKVHTQHHGEKVIKLLKR